jgi:hypothetical protein
MAEKFKKKLLIINSQIDKRLNFIFKSDYKFEVV